MRHARGPLAALLVVLSACLAPAQSVQYTATVCVAEAEVRSGAGESAQLYATNRLRIGDLVEVVKEVSPEWLEIKPPRGSFSWISTRFIQSAHPDQTLWTVHTRADVLMGSTLRSEKPTVRGARVEPGTILRSIGQARQSEDGLWLPVEPPPTEVRYIKSAAVKRNNPATPVPPTNAPVPTPPTLPKDMTTGTSGTSPSPAPAVSNDPRWLRAQQAEQAGNYAEAIQLYNQLGNQVANTDHALAVQAYSRANWLSDRTRGTRPVGTQRTDVRYPAPAPTPAPAPVTPPAPIPPGPLPQGWVTSTPGTLRPHTQTIDTRKAYILWSSAGKPMLHVVAGQGVNLDSYLNRNVELVGPRVYRPDLRADVMTVMQVKLLN